MIRSAKTWVSVVKACVALLVVAFVAWALRDALGRLSWRDLRLDPWLFVAALLTFIGYLTSHAAIWWLLTARHGIALPFGRTLAIWFYSVLGKYVPGKALLWGVRYYFYRRHSPGFQPASIVRCFFLEYLGSLVAGFSLLLVALAVLPLPGVPRSWQWLALLILMAGLGFMHPAVLGRIEQRVARSLKLTVTVSRISVAETIAMVLLYAAGWLILGLAMYLLAAALHAELTWRHYLYVTASYTLAGLAGFLAVFAPSGIGVREGVFIAALSRIMPVEIATVLAVLARVVSTVGELLAALGAMAVNQGLRSARLMRGRIETE